MMYILYRLRDFLMWEVPQGLKNLWRFRRSVWNFDDGSYSGFLMLASAGAKELSKHLYRHDMKVNDRKYARQILIFSELCKRIATEDPYYARFLEDLERPNLTRQYKKWRLEHVHYLRNQDIEWFHKIMKNLDHWWC